MSITGSPMPPPRRMEPCSAARSQSEHRAGDVSDREWVAVSPPRLSPNRRPRANTLTRSLSPNGRESPGFDSRAYSVTGDDVAIPALMSASPVWQKDEDARQCNYCLQSFTLLNRRHHCRICGLIFCDSCCPKPSGMNANRVCTACLRLPVDHASVLSLWSIGSGTFGTVSAGMLPDGRWCAIKCITASDNAAATAMDVHKEIGVMKSLQHRNIVQYLGSHLEDHSDTRQTKLYIFLEYVSGGALSLLLRKLPGKKLPLDVAKVYTRHVVEGLEYLHKNGIAHRDIKCANVLICFDTGCAKVADFGSAWRTGRNRKQRNATTFTGTPHWMAPEVLVSDTADGYNAMKADVWSVGCSIVEMVTGQSAWNPDCNPVMLMSEMQKKQFPTGFEMASLPGDVQAVLNLCFSYDPKRRPDMTMLKKLPFLRLVDAPTKAECGTWRTRETYAFRFDHLPADMSVALLSSGEVVCIRRTVAERKTQEIAYKNTIREMALLREAQHKHIVGLYGSVFSEVGDRVELKLFLEYVTGGALDHLLDKMPMRRLTDSVVRVYTRHLLQAVVFLHERGIAHRCISTSNLLVSQNQGVLKLSNFTEAFDPFSRSTETRPKSLCGCTAQIVAPEVVRSENGYDPMKLDIWSIGCVVAEMYTGEPPWNDYSALTTLYALSNLEKSWPDNVPDPSDLPVDLSDFLSNTFQPQADNRPPAPVLLRSSFVSLKSSRYG
ncbi:Mitogen-activated protein kinase kinase kinase 2 [Diplonema papillatum]|nr:Mitogen-activated protein kinase kinase kinase 2 [Diplonema papillatum]